MVTEAWTSCRGDGPSADIPSPVLCTPSNTLPGAKAIQLSSLNRIAALTWINASQRYRAALSPSGLSVFDPNGSAPRTAVVGDWIVWTFDNVIYSVPDAVFQKLYTTRRKK